MSSIPPLSQVRLLGRYIQEDILTNMTMKELYPCSRFFSDYFKIDLPREVYKLKTPLYNWFRANRETINSFLWSYNEPGQDSANQIHEFNFNLDAERDPNEDGLGPLYGII